MGLGTASFVSGTSTNTIGSTYHDRNHNLMTYKHWFGKRCSQCAN